MRQTARLASARQGRALTGWHGGGRLTEVREHQVMNRIGLRGTPRTARTDPGPGPRIGDCRGAECLGVRHAGLPVRDVPLGAGAVRDLPLPSRDARRCREASAGPDRRGQRSPEKPANVAFVPVDLDKDPELKLLPREVREAWKAQTDAPLPLDLVFAPIGVKLFAGKLDEAALKAMLGSPGARRSSGSWPQARRGSWSCWPARMRKPTPTPRNSCATCCRTSPAGRSRCTPRPLRRRPRMGRRARTTRGAFPKLEVGLVKLLRKDPGERWLVDLLLSSEEDLAGEKFARRRWSFRSSVAGERCRRASARASRATTCWLASTS